MESKQAKKMLLDMAMESEGAEGEGADACCPLTGSVAREIAAALAQLQADYDALQAENAGLVERVEAASLITLDMADDAREQAVHNADYELASKWRDAAKAIKSALSPTTTEGGVKDG